MRRRTPRPWLVAIVACVVVGNGLAGPLAVRADSTQDQLNALRAQEASQRTALAQLKDQQRAAQATLATLHADLSAKQADLEAVQSQSKQLSDQIAAMQTRENQVGAVHNQRVRTSPDRSACCCSSSGPTTSPISSIAS
jgi:septal ring factor EnvC (AmiA/AmiB activator)